MNEYERLLTAAREVVREYYERGYKRRQGEPVEISRRALGELDDAVESFSKTIPKVIT